MVSLFSSSLCWLVELCEDSAVLGFDRWTSNSGEAGGVIEYSSLAKEKSNAEIMGAAFNKCRSCTVDLEICFVS